MKQQCIEDEENKNNSENDNTAISPIIVDEYNDEIDNKLENDDAAVNQVEDNVNAPEESTIVGSLLITDEDHGQRSHNDGSSMSTVVVNISDDLASWPADVNQNLRNEQGLCFSKFHCKRKLPNGECIERSWIIYSQSANRIYCFYCKLFSTNTPSALSTSGFNNWSNLHTRLCEHESSKSHLEATWRFWELHQRLCSGQTIDKEHEIIVKEHANTGSKFSKG